MEKIDEHWKRYKNNENIKVIDRPIQLWNLFKSLSLASTYDKIRYAVSVSLAFGFYITSDGASHVYQFF